MDDRFRPIYERLYAEYLERASARKEPDQSSGFAEITSRARRSTAAMVSDAIDAAERELHLIARLRPDARYFLLINFTEMIAEPLFNQARPGTYLNLEEEIRKDIESILSISSNRAQRPTRKEIDRDAFVSVGEVSGGDVLKAIAAIYDSLRVTKFKVWN